MSDTAMLDDPFLALITDAGVSPGTFPDSMLNSNPGDWNTFSALLDDFLTEPVTDPAAPMAGRSGSRKSKLELLGQVLVAITSQRSEFLAQVWVPIVKSNRLLLTTQDQPFTVPHGRTDLARYRALSARYLFPAVRHAESCLHPGLPGRVFTRLAPEWTPNVQFYAMNDFLRVEEAARCNVRGTLAVPVIEPETRECLAVLELVTNVEKVEYEAELGIICSALQAVNLSSWNESGVLPEVPNEGREAVFEEIQTVLRTVCETHALPLAQTWIPCLHDGFGRIQGHASSDCSSSNATVSLFTKHAPCYVRDSTLRGFHQACSEHRLEVGQGVAGKAFMSNRPCFKGNLQHFPKEVYPLVHYARYFKLGAAVAIRLRSSLTGTEDYILEIILPRDCREVQRLMEGISVTMRQACTSLRTVSSEEVDEWSFTSRIVELREEEMSSIVDDTRQSLEVDIDELHVKKKLKQGGSDSSSLHEGGEKKNTDKKRHSNEKTVPLEVLQQYFAGSLRDAAKSLGVCPTTLKRICRQHGISRWPSRKINKVNRSLIKLQGVIESVEGVDRTVKLDALTGELASTVAATAAFTTSNKSRDEERSPQTNCDVDGAGKEGVNVFYQQAPTAVDMEFLKQLQRLKDDTVPVVKTEPRVHGSSAALSVLGNQDFVPVQAGGLEQEYHPPAGETCVDWSALRTRLHLEEQQTVTVKATLGGDTVRFKLAAGFGFCKLKAEVGKRFTLESESFTLKYMDDDAEWVILNGEADLEECLDVMSSSKAHVIKLVVHVAGHGSSSPSFCSVNS